MAVSIRQLRYLAAIAQHEHFGRAAAACSITQPALSMQIKELERELKAVLVERRRQGAQLTERGREVARRAARIVTDVRDLVDYAHHRDGVLTGPLHLGVIPSVAPYLLPPLLPLLRERYPDLELYLRETRTDSLLDELADGKLDVLVLALPVETADIETLKLFEDPFFLALPQSRKLSGKVRATPEMLANDRLLLLEEGHCLRDQALAYCNLRQVDHLDTFGASSLSTIVQMVAHGLGITLLPELSIGVEARQPGIKLLRFADPAPSRTLGLAWRATSPRRHEFLELANLMRAVKTNGRDRAPKG
jgi:LysR family transcriptional regulator, hydrogen peroxide-inducible genes activator